jgi:hypothetical protein
MEGGSAPTGVASRRWDAEAEQIFGQAQKGPLILVVTAKQLLDHSTFRGLNPYPGRIARLLWMHAIAIGGCGPWEEETGLKFHLTPPSHAIRGYPLKAGQCIISTPLPYITFTLPRSAQSGHVR